MKRRHSLRVLLLGNGIRATIKIADILHRAGPVALLCAAMLSLGAVCLATATLADSGIWKSWTRVFGYRASGPANHPSTSAEPQAGTGSSAYTITSFDAPGAGTSALEGTVGLGINASGAITGVYSNSPGVGQGFIRAANGTFTTFYAPDAGSATPGAEGTMPLGIDTNGDVAGSYIDASHAYHGFVRSAADGTITEFDAPGAPTATANRGTAAMAINDAGQVVGFYSTGSAFATSLYQGFLRAADGTITTLTEPNAGSSRSSYGAPQGTAALAINGSGEITGYYRDSSNNQHGFVFSSSGVYTSFDPPGSTTSINLQEGTSTGTTPSSIDAAGDVTGSYTDANFLRHGFVRTASGAITSFDVPGAVTTGESGFIRGTWPFSIDPGGNYIAGVYVDSTGAAHGFVYSQPLSGSGTFTSFDGPGATFISALPISGTGGFSVNSSGVLSGVYTDSGGVLHGLVLTPNTPAATPTLSPAAGTYTSAQTVTISDATAGATIYYTTNGTTPTTSSTVYTGSITVSSTETIEAIATASGYITSAVATAAYTINISPVAATPTFSPGAGTYSSAQSVTISDATAGAIIYYTTNGTTPTTSSTVYTGPITVSSTETIEAIATASGYTTSAAATAVYTIASSVPVLSSLSPAYVSAGSAGFTLTVAGSGFVTTSTVFWGSSSLATTYVSATELTAQVTAADIAAAGITSITVQTPAPGGGTSNALEFEVDSATSGTVTPPSFTTLTVAVAPGSTATYPVTLPSSATAVSVTCLDLPAGAACSYSASTGAVTITTSATTPAGTYAITVVFTETLPVASAALLLPLLLLPLVATKRKWTAGRIGFMACLALILMVIGAGAGCGGGSSSSGGSGSSPQTHQVTSSGVVTLTVQ